MRPNRYPPTKKGREFELKALGLRDFAGLRSHLERLDPFSLAHRAGLCVVELADVIGLLTESARAALLGQGREEWSGAALARTLPDGRRMIVLNSTQGAARKAATLMEEISHIFLGHQASPLARTDQEGVVVARDYVRGIEEEAYGVGAAALVPYQGLAAMIDEGLAIRQIATSYGVSVPLVEFRMRVCLLSESYLLFNRNWGRASN